MLDVRNSPLESHRLLHAIGEAMRLLNPLITLSALSAMLWLTWSWRRADSTGQAIGWATASLGLYLTLVHMVFQAEPRYANAYRGIELLLCLAGLHMAWRALGRTRPPVSLTSSVI